MGWDGMGWDWMGWDGMGWDGMGLDGMGRMLGGDEMDERVVSVRPYTPVARNSADERRSAERSTVLPGPCGPAPYLTVPIEYP
jgi:hypothetical protein